MEWIRCTESLPEEGEAVLICSKNETVMGLARQFQKDTVEKAYFGYIDDDDRAEGIIWYVYAPYQSCLDIKAEAEYWTPLPSLPK